MNRLFIRLVRGILMILGASILLVSSYAFQSQMRAAKKPAPEPEPPPQAPTLILNQRNIFTAEPRLGLEAWNATGETGEPVSYWKAQGTYYDSVSVGDIDGDGSREIVASAGCNLKNSTLNFINVFKDGAEVGGYEMGVWRSTYYDESQNLEETGNVIFNEIALADLDGDEANDDEIVLITRRWLAVYDFDPAAVYSYKTPDGSWAQDSGAVGKQVSINPLVPGDNAEIRVLSLKISELDGDPYPEILVVGWDFSSDRSYLFIYSYTDSDLLLDDVLEFAGVPTTKTLAVGNLDADDELELSTTGYKSRRVRNKNYSQSYLYIWDYDAQISDWMLHEIPVDAERQESTIQKIDIGQLDDDPEEEIVLASGVYSEALTLGIFNWNLAEGLVVTGSSVILDSEITLNHMLITDLEGDGTNEIALGGFYSDENPDNGLLYLEFFNGSLLSIWSCRGGESEQSYIRYIAIG